MRRKELTSKILAYACASALAVSSMAGYTAYTANAAEGIEVNAEDVSEDIILNGDENGGSSMIGTYSSENDDWKYLGFATLKNPTEEYKYLSLTYTGDISKLRFEFAMVGETGETAKSEAYWFNAEGQAYYFVSVDESTIPLVGEETTVVIDLEKSGISLGDYNSVHMHCDSMLTGGGFEITDAKIIKDEAEETTSEGEATEENTDIVLNGDENGGSSMIGAYGSENDDWKYLGFATLKNPTSAYKYLSLTYTGDISKLRFEFAMVGEAGETAKSEAYWFNAEGQAYYFVSVDESTIPLVGEETTVVIDLEKSGISLGDYNSVHMHCDTMLSDGGFEILDAKLIKDEAAEEESTSDGEQEVTTPDQSEDTTTAELPTEASDDIVLNGTDSGSSMVGTYKISASSTNQYKYLGFASLKDATADYKYLAITYTGDITSLRFEFAMVVEGTETAKSAAYWFNAEGQTNYFVTADESPIILDGGNGTTVVIDLEKTGINLGDYNGVHMHAGYGEPAEGETFPEFTFAITNARLSKTAGVKDSDKETVTQTPTTQAPTKAPSKPQTTTKAPETTKAVETTKAPETTTVEVKKPGKVKIKTAIKAKKAKKAKITLKKIKKAKGYEVRISTSKKFKNKNTVKKFTKKVTVTFKKLKKNKKYFVKARAYVLDANGKKVFGKWSKVKAVTAPKKSK